MKSRNAVLCIALAAGLPGLSHAAMPFYVGAAIGATREHSDYADQVTRARTSDPAPPTDIRIDTDHRATGRIFVGVPLAPSFALEADYADLGRLTTHAMWHGVDPFFQFERFGTIRVRAAALSVIGSAPIAAHTNVFARAGAAYTWVDYDVTGTAFLHSRDGSTVSFPSPTPPRRTGNGTRGVLGIGIEHAFTSRWSLRAEYARYFDVGAGYTLVQERGKFDLDLASLGVSFRY